MKRFTTEFGIKIETAAPYAHEQTGVAERAKRTVLERARALLANSRLPHILWDEAVSTGTYLITRTPTKAASGQMSPYEARFGTKPNLDHLSVFGCAAYVHIAKEQRIGKLTGTGK